MKFPLYARVALTLLVGVARSVYADGLPQPVAGADPTITVRGSESIVESLDMSPQATSFWRKIREVAKNIDLNDYEKVESQLSLDAKYRRPLARPMQFSYPSNNLSCPSRWLRDTLVLRAGHEATVPVAPRG